MFVCSCPLVIWGGLEQEGWMETGWVEVAGLVTGKLGYWGGGGPRATAGGKPCLVEGVTGAVGALGGHPTWQAAAGGVNARPGHKNPSPNPSYSSLQASSASSRPSRRLSTCLNL